ncbi:DMT family transporter [Changpingibacter yushuensis]|uniref:DMT family transporter n=1 Tax=Changpingibacter yushuensis TaxID=2758440 RepID=UPI0015F3E105|nr:DMT family transporter [Changpingibacter yushuensis]
MLSILVAVAVGLGLSIQTAVNSRLRLNVGSPFFSSLVSFAVGTVFLVLIVAIEGRGIHLPEGLPVWTLLGGPLGVLALTSNILLFPFLGAVETVLLPLLGQVLMSLIIDELGLFRANQHEMDVARGMGALLMLGGVLLAVMSKRGTNVGSQIHGGKALWRMWGIVAGGLAACQSAINGHLGVLLGSPLNAALISFSGGLLVLLILVTVIGHWPTTKRRMAAYLSSRVQSVEISTVLAGDDGEGSPAGDDGEGSPAGDDDEGSPAGDAGKVSLTSDDGDGEVSTNAPAKLPSVWRPWWIWTGGILGALFVFAVASLVPTLGTGLTLMFAMVGQVSGSMLVDHFGAFGAQKNPIIPIQAVGVIVMAVGVMIIRVM